MWVCVCVKANEEWRERWRWSSIGKANKQCYQIGHYIILPNESYKSRIYLHMGRVASVHRHSIMLNGHATQSGRAQLPNWGAQMNKLARHRWQQWLLLLTCSYRWPLPYDAIVNGKCCHKLKIVPFKFVEYNRNTTICNWTIIRVYIINT